MGPAHDFEQETIELLRRNPQAPRSKRKNGKNTKANSASNPGAPGPPGPQQGQTPADGTSGQRTTRPPKGQFLDSTMLATARSEVRQQTAMVNAVRPTDLPVASTSQHPAPRVNMNGYNPALYFRGPTMTRDEGYNPAVHFQKSTVTRDEPQQARGTRDEQDGILDKLPPLRPLNPRPESTITKE